MIKNPALEGRPIARLETGRFQSIVGPSITRVKQTVFALGLIKRIVIGKRGTDNLLGYTRRIRFKTPGDILNQLEITFLAHTILTMRIACLGRS